MGGGSWSASNWAAYAKRNVENKRVEEIYSSTHMQTELDPSKIKIRESCDSAEHPNSTPIIIGLDVTGSMNKVVHSIIDKLGVLVKEIYDRKPVDDPQIMFNAIGDCECDMAPLQVTQFESDIRIAEQLTKFWLEGGGGGNLSESYPLTWYFAANHTKIDSFDKHGKKGFIFTMGDDGLPEMFKAYRIEEVFGYNPEKDITTKEILNKVNQRYEVFHFIIEQGHTASERVNKRWHDEIGERAIQVSDFTKIPEIIVSILEAMNGKNINDVVSSWNGDTSIVVQEALSGLSTITQKSSLVKF